MPGTERVTDEQAAAALHEVMGKDPKESGIPQQVQEAAPEQSAVEETPVETEAVEQEQVVAAADDDLESLKTRLAENEQAIKSSEERFQSRLKAQQERYAANEQILRNRFLQKSTATDHALGVLRKAASEEGASQEEVARAISEMEGTMNQQSAQYAPAVQQPAPAANDDQALVVNNFLNEQGMDADEAGEFINWIQTKASTSMSPMEQAVANESVGGFMQLAHHRWRNELNKAEQESKRNDAVGAVKSVQRTQREAARAASSSPSAPKSQVVSKEEGVDTSKFTSDDISSLMRQSVEQYK